MSTDRPDDFDDAPTLQPVSPAEAELRGDYRDPLPPPTPGFGFWMSVVWCLFFFVVTQIVIGLACGIPIVLTAVFLDKNGPPKDPSELLKSDPVLVGLMISTGCAHLGGVALCWLLLRWQVGKQWKRKIALSRRPTATHAGLTLIGLVAMLAVGACVAAPIDKYVPSMEDLFRAVGMNMPMKGANEAIPELVKASPLALALFVVGVLPAFDEEFLCRGFLGWGLTKRYPTWAVVLMTSFLFGCLHVDPKQGLGAMFLGIAICLAYFATRSLWVAMALHGLNNSLGVLAIYFKDAPGGSPLAALEMFDQILLEGPALSKLLFALASFFLFGAVAYAFYQTRCKLVSIASDLPTWEPPGVSSVELPPPASGTIVTHAPLSATSAMLVLVASATFGLVLAFL